MPQWAKASRKRPSILLMMPFRPDYKHINHNTGGTRDAILTPQLRWRRREGAEDTLHRGGRPPSLNIGHCPGGYVCRAVSILCMAGIITQEFVAERGPAGPSDTPPSTRPATSRRIP